MHLARARTQLTRVCADVFVVVRPIKDKTTGATKYSFSCVSKDYVPAFKPDIPDPALFQLDEVFRNLILAKRTTLFLFSVTFFR